MKQNLLVTSLLMLACSIASPVEMSLLPGTDIHPRKLAAGDDYFFLESGGGGCAAPRSHGSSIMLLECKLPERQWRAEIVDSTTRAAILHSRRDDRMCLRAGRRGNVQSGTVMRLRSCNVTDHLQVFLYDGYRVKLASDPGLCMVYHGKKGDIGTDQIIMTPCQDGWNGWSQYEPTPEATSAPSAAPSNAPTSLPSRTPSNSPSSGHRSEAPAMSPREMPCTAPYAIDQGFEVSGIDLHGLDASKEDKEASFDFQLSACQCDETSTCISEVLQQGSSIYICVVTTAPNGEIDKVNGLTFTQGAFSVSPIVNGTADVLTAMFVEGKEARIRHQLISAFFTDPNPADVTCTGAVSLRFTNDAGRRVLRTAKMIPFVESASKEKKKATFT